MKVVNKKVITNIAQIVGIIALISAIVLRQTSILETIAFLTAAILLAVSLIQNNKKV